MLLKLSRYRRRVFVALGPIGSVGTDCENVELRQLASDIGHFASPLAFAILNPRYNFVVSYQRWQVERDHNNALYYFGAAMECAQR